MMDSNTLRAVAAWADQQIDAPDGEVGQYYWGYDGVSARLRRLADRIDAHGSLDRQLGDAPLD